MTNVTTGRNDPLQPYLEDAIRRADRIRFIVSFVMESGVKLIVPQLKQAADRGASIQLLTGFYLSITEPPAIYYLHDQLGSAIDIRVYDESIRAFHPKSYIFECGDEAEVFVGSSNLSRSALTFPTGDTGSAQRICLALEEAGLRQAGGKINRIEASAKT